MNGDCNVDLKCSYNNGGSGECVKVTPECPAGWIPLANTCPKDGDDQDVLCVPIVTHSTS